MTKQKVLIITHSADNTSTSVVMKKIQEAGGEAIRFDVDRYPLEASLTTTFVQNRFRVQLHTNGKSHDLDDVTAIAAFIRAHAGLA